MRTLTFLLIGFAVVVGAYALPAPRPAAAQAGGCFFSVNGADIGHFNHSRRALRVHADQPIEVTIISQRPVGTVHVLAQIGPFEREYEVGQVERPANADWAGLLDLSDQLELGAGLQQLLFTTNGGCNAIAWVDLAGTNRFTTFLGLCAVALLAVGLPAEVWAVRRAARGGHGLIPAVVAGVAVGLGLALLSQEFSRTPLSNGWVVLWVSLPVTVFGSWTFALQRRHATDDPDDDDDEDDYDMTDAHFAIPGRGGG